ncbi:MAG: PEP-CTERM sorting domain-containing protein [Myxococcales bacterium]|nr:PEP-CTERM sorting domain-containing protein [Myxococcales bacterium]
MTDLHGKLLRMLLSLALLAIVGRAPAASAVPIFFEGPGAWGFDPADAIALGIDYVVGPGETWQSAGDPSLSPSLEVTTSLIGLIGPEPVPPTPGNPLLGIVQYQVTNTTGSVLDGGHLVFTLGAVDGAPDPWPFIEPDEFGLESDGILILHAAPYYFGAVALPTLAPGAVHAFQIVHVVSDDLGGTVIPTPGLALLANQAVPEPGAALLVAVGLGVLVALARRRNEQARDRTAQTRVQRATGGIPNAGVSFGHGGR